jgi:hypothetical protein
MGAITRQRFGFSGVCNRILGLGELSEFLCVRVDELPPALQLRREA